MLYVSDLLGARYPLITSSLKQVAAIVEIPQTKDIWVRDFMPIKSTTDEWVLFRFFPKYLQNPKYRSLLTDNRAICSQLGLDVVYSPLLLDGGSVVYKDSLYIVSERVLKDNPQYSTVQIRDSLTRLFQTDKVIQLPEAPNDFTGHMDGVLSILDGNSILLNDYRDEYGDMLKNALRHYGFDLELLPYNADKNRTFQSAKGIYMNYIEHEANLLVPIFNQKLDDAALVKLASLYPNFTITPIECNALAKEGGLLHCISW